MLCRGLIILLVVLTVSGSVSAAVPTGTYSLRDIQLGISLNEFRQMQHPDVTIRGQARVACSNDPTAAGLDALRLTSTMLQAEIVKCGFFLPAAKGDQRVAAPMEFFGEQVTPLFMFYHLPGEEDYALAQITFAMASDRGDQLIGLFYRTYGNATSLEVTAVPTSFGRDLADVTYIWNNGVSALRLDTLTLVFNQMSVVLTENRLWGNLSARFDAVDRMNRVGGDEGAVKPPAAGEGETAVKPEAPAWPPKPLAAPTDWARRNDESAANSAGESVPDPTVQPTEKAPASDLARSKSASPAPGKAPSPASAPSAASPSYAEPPINLPPVGGSTFTFK
jgi:hypothetical protein